MGQSTYSNSLLDDLGRRTGQLAILLEEQHSYIIESRVLSWDNQHVLQKAHWIQYIPAKRRKFLDYFLNRFKHDVNFGLDGFKKQLIHGDLNEWNIFVLDGRLSGIIDFSDMCFSPRVNDLAIAIAYALMYTKDRIPSAQRIVSAYHKINPLTLEEIDSIYVLVGLRLSNSLLHSHYAQHINTADDYITGNQEQAFALLEELASDGDLAWKSALRDICGLNPVDQRDDILLKRMALTSPALSLSYELPIHMEQALFQYMFDASGNRYLDAYNNIPHVGHSHPKINDAIARQQRRLNTNSRYAYNMFADYAEHLLSYFPPILDRVIFVNSGSEATDLALRMAKVFTRKSGVLALKHGYHGHTQLGIDVSSYKHDGQGGSGSGKNVLTLPLPKPFSPEFTSGVQMAKQAAAQVQQANIDPACFLYESISGCGGQVVLADDYISTLRSELDDNILFIADEVQTGFGRIGEHFWGFQLHETVPDIVLVGKSMGNGHPIAAVICSKEIADAFNNGMEFFSSYGGNPVSCAAGKAVLEVLEEEKLQQNSLDVGRYYLNELRRLQEKHSSIADTRGQGLFIGIELIQEDMPASHLAKRLVNQLKENYILLSTDGPHNNVVKSKPPLCFTRSNVDEVVTSIDSFLSSNRL